MLLFMVNLRIRRLGVQIPAGAPSICPFTQSLATLTLRSARDKTVIEGEVKWLKFQLRAHAELSLAKVHLVDHAVMDLFRQ